MSISDLKSDIINKVQQSNDEGLLNEVYNLIKAEADLENVYVLTDVEKTLVEEGLEDLKAGRVVSSEKANELIREWLKK